MQAVFDLEANGYNPDRIHCIAAYDNKLKSTTSYANMRSFFSKAKVLIGHNIIRFDIPVVGRILGIKIKARLVDTLALSWYLFPERKLHGLADWGEYFGVPKPPIDDWEGLTPEEYLHRCREDVKINTKLWNKIWKKLLKLYGSEEEAWRLIDYLTFKMECAREQERSRWKLDVEHCTKTLTELERIKEEKVEELFHSMPKVATKAKRSKPKKPFKQDGSYSAIGEKWFSLLKEKGLPENFDGEVEVVTGYKDPNPNSHDQIKKWLYDLGWVPESFDYKRNKETGDVRKIPQISPKGKDGVCHSVKRLFDKEPALRVLEGLSVVSHRITILKGFLENVDEEGYIKAQIQGFTNTLRFKHRVVVNLPGVDKPYGNDIRGCLIAPDGYELCGSDMCSLEDRTKQHYMWPHDPEYVQEMMTDDFDPHLDLAVFAKALTTEQANAHKKKEEDHGVVRKMYKSVNYAAVYGSGAETMSRTANCSVPKAKQLIEAYWKRNWSVKAIADEQIVKVVERQKWLYNPVSKLWYSLRHDKDRFSTLNQGTGVFCFDTWIMNFRKRRGQLTGQFHDEVILCIKKGYREQCTNLLKQAIVETNQQLKLNRELDVDVQFGDNYAAIH